MSPSLPSSMRILVAEPETIVAEDLRRRLERFGYTVAGTVRSAGELGRFPADFDVLLSEAVLEGGADGIAPAVRLAAERNAPLVFLSKDPDEETVRRMIEARPEAFILKPLKERELITTLGLAAWSRRPDPFDLPCGLEPGGEGILIIEDEKIVALDERRRLERAGFKVVGMAPSAEEGIDLARELRPALVTTCINLEGPMDGIEGAAAIRDMLDIPIVFLTAFADEITLERVRETRPEAYILKPCKEKELFLAIRLALAKYEAKVRPPDPAGIFAAARRGTPADLQAALAGLSSPDVRDPGGRTPLMYAAARSRDPETVRTLLRAGADPDVADSHGRTALFYAVAGETPGILEALLALDADRTRRDSDGFSALDYELLGRRRTASVAAFLAAGEDPNQIGPDGRSLPDRLLEPKRRGDSDAMGSLRLLLDAGMAVDRTRFGEIRARGIWLFTEAAPGRLPSLLSLGVEIDRRGEEGRTALHWSAVHGSPDALAALLASGADPEVRDQDGSTPLMLCAERYGDAGRELQVLLEGGSLLESRDGKGRTALIRACIHGRDEHCAFLLERGADPNARDEDGRTALHIAAGFGSPSAIETLLDAGADPKIRDAQGEKPYNLAKDYGFLADNPVLARLRAAAEEADEENAPQ